MMKPTVLIAIVCDAADEEGWRAWTAVVSASFGAHSIVYTYRWTDTIIAVCGFHLVPFVGKSVGNGFVCSAKDAPNKELKKPKPNHQPIQRAARIFQAVYLLSYQTYPSKAAKNNLSYFYLR